LELEPEESKSPKSSCGVTQEADCQFFASTAIMDELCVVSHLPAPFLFVKSANGSLRTIFALYEFISENVQYLGRQGA
jgi:hypothetical protein